MCDSSDFYDFDNDYDEVIGADDVDVGYEHGSDVVHEHGFDMGHTDGSGSC